MYYTNKGRLHESVRSLRADPPYVFRQARITELAFVRISGPRAWNKGIFFEQPPEEHLLEVGRLFQGYGHGLIVIRRYGAKHLTAISRVLLKRVTNQTRGPVERWFAG